MIGKIIVGGLVAGATLAGFGTYFFSKPALGGIMDVVKRHGAVTDNNGHVHIRFDEDGNIIKS